MQDLLNVVDFDLYMCGHDHCKNIIKTKTPIPKTIISFLI